MAQDREIGHGDIAVMRKIETAGGQQRCLGQFGRPLERYLEYVLELQPVAGESDLPVLVTAADCLQRRSIQPDLEPCAGGLLSTTNRHTKRHLHRITGVAEFGVYQ